MNIDHIKILQDVITSLRQEVDAIKADLSISILEGAPFLLTIQKADEGGSLRIYGTWDGQRGFKHEDTLPVHLCGAVGFTPENSAKNIDHLKVSEPTIGRIHRREFLARIMERKQRSIDSLTNLLGVAGQKDFCK